MYTKVPTSLQFAQREQTVLDFWRDNDIFNKSIALREGAEVFTFYDGPPTANGQPHIGHIITRAVKDAIPRYQTMKGKRVVRKAGWDTHGLPVELEVEKDLGIDGKPQIETYGVEPFIKKCKESVWKYKNLWEEMSRRVGFWADMDAPYVTYHNEYIESVWWALSQIWEKGLMYKSYRVVPYCPRCGTPLSSHEVAQGYKDVVDPSIFVSFAVAGRENEYLMAWTTTPWTLPSNVALVVNANIEYARVAYEGKVYILAKALAESVFDNPYEILETFQGQELEGLKYEPLYCFAPEAADNQHYCTVVCDDYVALTTGSGIVHIAPAFGEDDARISKAYGLPLIQLVDEQGCFTQAAHLFAGQFVKAADKNIMRELKNRGQLFKRKEYEHSYPFCWRCDTPLLYYARNAWFIRMSELRNELVGSNDAVNWLPGHMKKGRFGNFIENVIDWSLSRERYWGTPLPIWICEKEQCAHQLCIGSIAELKEKGRNVPDDIELHKPYIDAITLPCPQCGGEMRRTPEVIDCWFDAGAMPFAQWHYPFENKGLFEEQFPADFISEAIDQTRGWFYTLMAISTILFGQSPYRNVIVLGHVQNKEGQKMSKSKGDVVDPMEALQKHGADAVRWFFYAYSAPWNSSRYSDDAVTEAQRKFMGTLWNTYAFYVLYAEIDQFNPYQYEIPDIAALSTLDRWILSRLHTLIQKVDACLSAYDLNESARAMEQFVDELSNWYLRRSRERFWAGGMEQDKVNAYKVLHTVLVELAKLAAPFVPFMTELMYQNLVRGLCETAPLSVHLCDYPVANSQYIDAALEQDMERVLDMVQLGRAARNASNIKTRQPLAEMLVALPFNEATPAEGYIAVVREELNVKTLRFVDSAAGYTAVRIKPNLRTLGPRYGKLVPKITAALNADTDNIMEALQQGAWQTEIDGTSISLESSDVLVENLQKEGYSAASDKGMTVVLDTTLTPALIEEGHMRELVSKWQNMRRDAGFDVVDTIRAGYGDSALSGVIARNQNEIAAEILAAKLENAPPPDGAYTKEWDINGEGVQLWVLRV